jgi:hypothetical protein
MTFQFLLLIFKEEYPSKRGGGGLKSFLGVPLGAGFPLIVLALALADILSASFELGIYNSLSIFI